MKTDMRGNILEASTGIYSILIMSEEEAKKEALVGKSIEMLMSPENWAQHQKYLAEENLGEDMLMNRVVYVRNKKVKLTAQYLTTEKVFIINMKEI